MPSKKRTLSIIGATAAFIAIAAGIFFTGFFFGKKRAEDILINGASDNTPATGTIPAADFLTLWQAWQILSENYLRNASATNQSKLYGAIDGLVRSLGDPYTIFFTPKASQQFQEDVQGSFGGVGIEIGMKKEQLVVIAPLKDTPASRAGILAGDYILKINSSSTDGMTIDEAISKIRGSVGSPVTLSIFPDACHPPQNFKLFPPTITAPTLH